MSESDGDELGSYDPTTPFKPVAVKNPPGRQNSRAIAGPSSKPASATGGGARRKGKRVPEQSDVEEIEDIQEPVQISSGDEDHEHGRPPSKRKRTEVPAANGKAPDKGKAKAKAKAPTRTSRRTAAVAENDIELVEDSDAEASSRPMQGTVGKNRKAASTTSRPSNDISVKELDRLRQKLSDVEGQREALAIQLEQLFSIRNTEAETALEERCTQYEARAKTQEALIQELTSQLARVEPLTRSGKAPLLHFLTREAADEEKRSVEKEVSRWKDVAEEKDKTIRQKDKRIAELEQTEKDLRYELRLEIERSKGLASKAPRGPPSASRGRAQGGLLGSDNPKDVQVVKFYEDLTNLLVISMKFEQGQYLNTEDTLFTCVYTYAAQEQRPGGEASGSSADRVDKSLSFTLRLYHDLATPNDPNAVTAPDQIMEVVRYTPMELDKEPDDFVDKLDFLNAQFTFGRDQLSLFLNELYKTMGNAVREDAEDEGDEAMEDGEEAQEEGR